MVCKWLQTPCWLLALSSFPLSLIERCPRRLLTRPGTVSRKNTLKGMGIAASRSESSAIRDGLFRSRSRNSNRKRSFPPLRVNNVLKVSSAWNFSVSPSHQRSLSKSSQAVHSMAVACGPPRQNIREVKGLEKMCGR